MVMTMKSSMVVQSICDQNKNKEAKKMKRISTFTRSLYAVNALLVINAVTGIGTGIWYLMSDACMEGCVYFAYFLFGWGMFGLVNGIFLYKRYQWAIWGGSLFFLLQSIGIITNQFYYYMNVGLRFILKVGEEGSIVGFNLLAIAAIIILIGSYVREAQADLATDEK